MKQILLCLILISSLSCSLSDVAFTSKTDFSKSQGHILKNQIFKNENPTEDTKDCAFFRDFEIVYKFENKEKKHIYYFLMQCLDQGFGIVKSDVKFNYDGGSEMMSLPDGCMPPSVPIPEKNPCENGFALGSEVVEEIGTMLIKKLVHHPLQHIPKEGIAMSIDSDKLDTVRKNLPELAKKMEDLLEQNHASNTENRKPDDELINEDGSKTEIYNFANGDVAERTPNKNGDIETILYKEDGTVEVKTEMPSGISDVTLYGKDGLAIYHKSIEPSEHDPDMMKITTYNYNDEIVGKPEYFPKNPNPVPLDVNFTDEVVKSLEESNVGIAESIQDYVNERLTCFAENLINVKESYLTFVCSTTGHASIQDLIRKNFAETIMCGKDIDCDEIEAELLDKMLTDINMGGTGHGVQTEASISQKTEEDPNK